jgi:hypothetical protein
MMSVCIIYVKGGNGRFRPQRDVVWAKTSDLVSGEREQSGGNLGKSVMVGNGRFRPQRDVLWAKTPDSVSLSACMISV